MSFQSAKVVSAAPVSWSNAQLFNGYIIFTVVLPTGYTTVKKAGASPAQELPLNIRIPIANGVISPFVSLPFGSSCEPPNTSYTYTFYDFNDKLIASGAVPVSVATDTVTIAVPTLTTPV